MFKLNKPKSIRGRGARKFDFQFSDFQAIKVPKGWDKLFVSLVSVETGKTSVKSGKSSVRNGICRWTETLHESVSIAQEKGDTKELQGCLCRFVVAMGSSRSGVLGEVTVNLADYASSKTSVPLSLFLKKCNYGTSLQFKIQCLTPNANDRDSQNKDTVTRVENGNDDFENRSDASEGSFSRSMASMSGNHLESTSAGLSRDPSLSASDSQLSFESIEASPGHDMLSPQNHLFGSAKQKSVESQNSVLSHSIRATDDRSNHSSMHSRVAGSFSHYAYQEQERNSSASVSSPRSNTGSSKDLLEAADGTNEELRAEARMWERNAKKLSHDMEVLRHEMSEQARSQETLCLELSASQQECGVLKQEIEHLKILLEESAKEEDKSRNMRLQFKDIDDAHKEMEEELRFHKESNADLTEQLQKTQESNVELLSILQELEAIVETQKLEIENLSSQKLNLQESENRDLTGNLEVSSNFSMSDIMDPNQNPSDPFPEGIQDLKIQLQQLQETQEELESSIRVLEKSLEEKDDEIEREQDFRVKALLESESKWRLQLAAKEEEIMILEAKLSEYVKLVVEIGDETDLAKEISILRSKVVDLEKNCNEVTEENVQLLLKLKEQKNSLLSSDTLVVSPCTCNREFSQLKELQCERSSKGTLVEDSTTFASPNYLSQILHETCKLLDNTLSRRKSCGLSFNIAVDHNSFCFIHDLENKSHEPLTCKEQLLAVLDSLSKINECFEGECNRCRQLYKLDIEVLEEDGQECSNLKEYANCIHFQGATKPDHESDVLRERINTLEDQMASYRDKNLKLQETIDALESEKSSFSERVEELKKEIALLSGCVDSHVTEKKVLERLSSELGKGKEDLEQHLSDLEKENMQLSERISAMETQLRYLTEEKETCLLDLRHSESQSMKLRDEIGRLEIEVHTLKVECRLKVQDMQSRWLEAQEECEYLKIANPKLQSTAEHLIEEFTSLQKLNGELKRQNMALSKQCTLLESQLRDSQEKFTKCSEKVKTLEEEFLLIGEEVSLKEQSLKSELQSLVMEDREHREKVMQENVLLNEQCKLKVVEVENLQKELVHLIDQISVAPNDQGISTTEAILEVSILRAEKAKLEVSIHELTDKFALSQNKLSTLEAESEAKVQQLTEELIALRKNQEVLLSNHGNLLVSLENYRSREVKHKNVVNELEINLKAFKCERLQLAEEISSLKEQLQRANLIHAEVLDLKTLLNEAKFECEKVKSSFELLRGDHEELKSEKESLVQKLSSMQKSLLELADCQRSKIALEEKVLRLEGDLAAKEVLYAQYAELKFELNKIKRENGELQRKIKHLEDDLEGFLKKLQVQEKLQPSETMLDQMNSDDPGGCTRDGEHSLEVRRAQSTDYLMRIQCLESELAEALETNDLYKAQAQLKRFMSEELGCSDDLKKSGSDNILSVERRGSNMASEVELKDLREKYLQMSLRYAEVEAQRDELVLKLKSTNNRKGWFF